MLSKNKKQSSELNGGGSGGGGILSGGGRKNKNKKNKDGGGMGGLTSLLGALHEETTRSNIFTENIDLEMMETYSQPTRPASTGSESGSLTPASNADESPAAPVFNLPNGDDNADAKNDVINEMAAHESVRNDSLSNGDMNNNNLSTTPDKELHDTEVNSSSTQQSEEVTVNENENKKTRKLIKVSLKTSKSKNFLSGKEYTI